jgi:hypothetical protein
MTPFPPVAAALLIVVCSCRVVSAQIPDDDSGAMPRAFIGAGVTGANSDAGSRIRLFEEESSLVWLIEGSVALSRHVGVGVEFGRPSTVSATTSGNSFHESGRQTERLLIGLLRARVMNFSHGALEVVAGGGVLFQHHERRFAPCFSGCEDLLQQTLDHRAPTLAFGVDAPIPLTRHFSVGAVARVYALDRGKHTTEDRVLIPWPFEWKSSTRISAGATARLTW